MNRTTLVSDEKITCQFDSKGGDSFKQEKKKFPAMEKLYKEKT